MSNDVQFLLKVGELALKGGNRKYFEKILKNNIKQQLHEYKAKVFGGYGRFYARVSGEYAGIAESVLGKTFGLTGFARCYEADKDLESIKRTVLELAASCLELYGNRFKIESRRTDKGFEKSSYELNCLAGDWIRDEYTDAVVEVKKPDWMISIEIREQVYIYGPVQKGQGGLPVGVAGKGILMLSGGIDSPVAGYMMAKRGLSIESVYFHAYPYTSDDALEKVKTLARKVAVYTNGMKLHVVNFTKLQLRLKEKGLEKELTLHMRAAMMTIAHRLAEGRSAVSIITGESLSQVASQTAQSLRYTNSFTDYPVFRPLIGLDKEEIITTAKNIDTFETSILPYEDCCTIFSPKNPAVRPKFDETVRRFSELGLEDYMTECIDTVETFSM